MRVNSKVRKGLSGGVMAEKVKHDGRQTRLR